MICRCLQALAEALKENKSITNMNLGRNDIGAEGAKAWCGVGSVECCGMLWIMDVMSPTPCDRNELGWFGGPVVSAFISVQVQGVVEYVDVERNR